MIFNALPYGLYLVANFVDQNQEKFLWCIKEALSAGVDIVQLRAKNLNQEDFYILAQKIKIICMQFDKPFIINDHVYIAKKLNCGVHLGSSDMPLKEARCLLGDKALIGSSLSIGSDQSCYADYLAASPIFYTPTKPDAVYPCGIRGLRELIMNSAQPIVAIGGIHEHNIKEILATGCRFIAVVSAVMNASDPFSQSSKLRKILRAHYGA